MTHERFMEVVRFTQLGGETKMTNKESKVVSINNDRFQEVVRFMNGITVEEVYGTSAIKRYVIVEDIVEEEDVVLLPTFVPGIKTMDMVYR